MRYFITTCPESLLTLIVPFFHQPYKARYTFSIRKFWRGRSAFMYTLPHFCKIRRRMRQNLLFIILKSLSSYRNIVLRELSPF